MRYPVRHLCTLSVLLAYGLIAVGGEALHALYHDCSESTPASVGVEGPSEYGTCCHSHVATEATGSEGASARHPQDGQPDNGPTHHHDEDSCLLCQHLAKAQAELPSLSANEVADPIVESQVVESDVIPVRQAAAHDCRGPPIV